MSHNLLRLLDKDDEFSRVIHTVESTLDGNAIDVSLIGEIAEKAARLHRRLRLDPRDTTAEELYQVLLGRIREDNMALARTVGGIHGNAVSEMSPRIIAFLQHRYKKGDCFAPRSASLKRILKDNPPRETMKLLRYRSLPSMLKHETPESLVVLARYLEDDEWHARHDELLTTFTPQDMTLRPPLIIWLDKVVLIKALSTTSKRHYLVLHAKEAGIVALAPTNEKVIEGFTIRTLSLMMYYVQELWSITTLGKLLLSQPDFGSQYADMVSRRHDDHIRVAGYPVHWRSMHHAVGLGEYQERFEPHITSRDWRYESMNDVMASFFAHDVWQDMGSVITGHDELVSSNIIDLAIDVSHGSNRRWRTLKYGRRELEHELLRRYVAQPRIYEVLLHRLHIA